MKRYINVITGLMVSLVSAQQLPEIIYCNQFQNVALVMSAPIAQAVTGSENYVFSYNQTAVDSLGLLQGRPGKESNLLIRTTDGGLYSYLLRHSDSLTRFVYFIKPDARINPIPAVRVSTIRKKSVRSKKDSLGKSEDYYQKLSLYYLNRSPVSLATKNKDRIKLEVQGMYYYKDDVFMVIRIQNKSGIDFKINTLELAKIHGSKSRKSSFQKLPLEVVYKYDYPAKILSGFQRKFVLVYPKFTLGDHEKFQLSLNEAKGNRYLSLKLSERDTDRSF